MDFDEKRKEHERQRLVVEESLKNAPKTRQDLKNEAKTALKNGDSKTAVIDLTLIHEIDEAREQL